MQLRYALTTFLLALCCADTVLGRHVLPRRQDGTSATPASTAASEFPSPTAKSSAATDAAKSQTTNNGTGKGATASTTTTGKDAAAAVTTSHPTAKPTSGNGQEKSSKDAKLPIKPTITPAVGIAGVFLMLTGVAYTIIGIKHQWLVVFLSAAYLTSLSVTVLIIYVMSPPVSDAIQGAYMVAAVITGLIFGALSLVFKEVTEGLGCLLGGFCLSMWFLVLKPGSLIPSTTGRAVMIGVFSAVGWSLSFSAYTRNYGLIFCTAFAGAMITMLGIDCFSRAGLKEFWIYIWALNDQEFPIHTTTYPIARGIRVEIAGTIVLFIFGVMSQIKIWKIVKERKSKKEAARQAEADRRDQRDSAIGKRVEANNERSLAQWEAVYGDKDYRKTHDSGVGTSVNSEPKKSTSVVEREIETIEMDDMNDSSSNAASKRPQHYAELRNSPDEAPLQGPELQLDLDNGDYSWWADFRSNKAKSNVQSASSVDQSSMIDQPPVPAGPAVMPLPFSPLVEKDEEGESANASAESKAAEEISVQERRGMQLDKLTLKKLNEQAPAALARIDDDRASSVAATANDDLDMDAFSTKRQSVAPSTYQLDLSKGNLSLFSDEFKLRERDHSASRTPGTPGTPAEAPVFENDDEELIRPPTADERSSQHNAKQQEAKKRNRESTASDRRATGSDDEDEDSEHDVASIHSLKNHLPEGMSKVAMAYRTNEWAKHITDADQPNDEESPAEVDEPSTQVEIHRPAKEMPKPVETDALLETAAPDHRISKAPNNPNRQSRDGKAPRRSSAGTTPVYAFSRATSYQSLQRQDSSTSIQHQAKRETRNSSALFAQQALLESPMEDDTASSHQDFATPLGSTANLLDSRNDRMKKRITTTSFNALNSAASANPITTSDIIGPETDAPAPPSEPIDEENLTLAQRKVLVEQGIIQPASPPQTRTRQSSNPVPNRTSNQQLIYDSHQPKRSNTVDTVKQNAMLTQWRQSLQQESYASKPNAVAEEQARMAMLNQRQAAAYRHQKEQVRREARESMKDVAMRTQQLTDRHQDAIRRMQAKANAKAAGKE